MLSFGFASFSLHYTVASIECGTKYRIMPNCSVLSCKNSTKNVGRDDGNVSFHRFPTDPIVKEKWINATGRVNWFPTKHSRICSDHFNESNFKKTKKFRRLTAKAIPTINVLKTATYDQISSLCGAPSESRRARRRKSGSLETDSDSSNASRSGHELDESSRDDDRSQRSRQTSSLKDTDIVSGHVHEVCYCNECENIIRGFRYVCVQCTDVDLCSACEAAGLHELHYVLRVPGRKSEEEVTSILRIIREELFKHESTLESVQIKTEDEDVSDPIGMVDEISIEAPDNDNRQVTSIEMDIQNIDTEITSFIPNKRSRSDIVKFFKFKDCPSNVTTESDLVVPKKENIFDSVDIKVEDAGEEKRCEVFTHKDVDTSSSGSNTKTTDCAPWMDQHMTIDLVPRLSNLPSAPGTSDVKETGTPSGRSEPRGGGSRDTLEPVKMVPKTIHKLLQNVQDKRPNAKRGRYFVEVTSPDDNRKGEKPPEKK